MNKQNRKTEKRKRKKLPDIDVPLFEGGSVPDSAHEVSDTKNRNQSGKEVITQRRPGSDLRNAQFYYDHLPAGNFTLNRDGIIIEIISGADPLSEADRSFLRGKRFEHFLAQNSQSAFNRFLKKVFESETRQYGEFNLKCREGEAADILVNGIFEKEMQKCILSTVVIIYYGKPENTPDLASLQWETTFDSSGDGICLLDKEQKILRCNSRMKELFTLSDEHIIGQSCWKIMHGSEGPIQGCPVEKMKMSLQREHLETKLSGRWFELTADPLFDPDHSLRGAIHTVRDITDRKRAEQSLRESQERYQNLVELSPIGIAMYQDGKFVYANPAGLAIIGASNPDELNGKSVVSVVHEDSRNEVIRRMSLVGNGIPVPPMEEKLLRLNGEIFYAEVTATSTTFNDRPAGQVLIRDITERIKAQSVLQEKESKYRTLLEFAPDAFFQGDQAGNLIMVNDRAILFTAYSRDELLKMNFSQLFPPEVLNDNPLNYELLMQTDTLTSEREIIKKTGERIHVEMNSKAMPDGTYQCFMRDITDRKQVEDRLLKLNQQLNDLNATKDKLLSIVAHDLKNPFNSILGFSNLLCQNVRVYDIEKTEKFLDCINSSTKHTLTLLDNLLLWAKSQTGQLSFDPKPILIHEIIRETIEALKSSAKIKNINLNSFQSGDTHINADSNMIHTVLRNLVTNAIKFTNPGGKIDVFAIGESGQIEITVKDDGVGMKEEIREKLFKMESYLTTVGTSNEKGSGLGLILCQEFIQNHGGRIWVESEVGKGSEFHIILPKK
jgi:PAS domain S-box-containing protein